MQPSVFWERALLRGFAEECIWHAIQPTIMMSMASAFDDVRHKIDRTNVTVIKAHKANFYCVSCDANVERSVGSIDRPLTLRASVSSALKSTSG